MRQPCIFQEARDALGCASSNSHTLFCALLTSCAFNISTLMHELVVKWWRWSYTSEVVRDGGLTVIFILWMCIPRNSMQIEILQTISNLRLMKVQEFKAKNTFTLNFPLQALIYSAVSLVKIYKRSLSKSRSVFGRISRRDRCVIRGAIAVINRLAFLAGFRGAMRAIAQRSLSSIA